MPVLMELKAQQGRASSPSSQKWLFNYNGSKSSKKYRVNQKRNINCHRVLQEKNTSELIDKGVFRVLSEQENLT